MANKVTYQMVGRYMDGKEVTGYHLQSLETGKQGKYTREQVCYLVGRGQVSNCSGQLYQDKVLLRGVGTAIEDLPIQQENGAVTNTASVGKVRRNDTAVDIMTKLLLTASIINGRNVVGYVVANAGGGTKCLGRSQVLTLARDGKIGNARVQESKDPNKPILRGVGINLTELPSMTAEELGLTI